MYGSVEAEFEVQRTIKRAELAFSCLLNRVIGPIKVYVDNKGIINGLRERTKESASCRQREMPICGSKFGKNCII